MNSFNKYQFIEDLENEIVKRINKGYIDCLEAIYDEMHTAIDDACIYYADCFDICKELNATDFTAYDIECNTIDKLAYACLYQYTMDELDVNKLEELIETINA